MNFGEAFEQVKKEKGDVGMRLSMWSPDIIIRAQYPDTHSKMTQPYLYVDCKLGRVPWIPSIPELFLEDWVVEHIY